MLDMHPISSKLQLLSVQFCTPETLARNATLLFDPFSQCQKRTMQPCANLRSALLFHRPAPALRPARPNHHLFISPTSNIAVIETTSRSAVAPQGYWFLFQNHAASRHYGQNPQVRVWARCKANHPKLQKLKVD